jgi:ribosomal protein L34E
MRVRVGTCSDCHQQFDHHKIKGFVPKRCPSCQRLFANARMRRWREVNPEKTRASYERENAKRLADPEHLRKKREREALRLYGMTPEEYNRKLAEQDGKCAICRKAPQGRPNGRAREVLEPRLHNDHCHVTNRFRGLLCSNCNTGLGLFGDDPEVLMAAAEYLRKG